MSTRSFSFEAPPASGTIQMCGVFLFAARSTSTAANSTHLPSGEGTGSPTRFSFIMSSKVKGRLVSEKEREFRTPTSRRASKKRRRMRNLQQKRTKECSTAHQLINARVGVDAFV